LTAQRNEAQTLRGICSQNVCPSVSLSVTPKRFRISIYTSHRTIKRCF